MKKYIFLQVGIIFILCNVSAQSELPQLIPPYPTSAIYQRYAATPPNLSTGAVSVNIPLYTLNIDGLSLPFSLNYQTSGIKVLDPFYPLGYGWVFSPGLRISRTIMGNPDDRFPRSIRNADEYRHDNTEEKFFLYLKSLLMDNTNTQDAQYDIFSLHLPEENVRFVLEKENNTWKAVTIGSAVKITPVLSSDRGYFNGFEVTDGRGIIYQFGEPESYPQPLAYTAPGSTSTYMEMNRKGASAWMLRKIILPGKDNTIDFNWYAGKYGALLSINYFSSTIDRFMVGQCYNNNTPSTPDPAETFTDVSLMETTNGNPFPCMYLKEVSFRSGKIEITYDADKFMQTMKVYSKNTGADSIVKSINFNMLTSIQKKLLKDVTIGQEKYVFEYNESQPFLGELARDWWGYFNGRDNITSIPTLSFTLENSGGIPNVYVQLGEANKEIDENAMQQNILTKVIYPTGGYSMYEYETHRFDGQVFKEGGGLRVKKIITKESAASPEIVAEYRYGSNESGVGFCTMEPVPSSFFQEMWHEENYLTRRPLTDFCQYSYRSLTVFPDSRISSYTAFNPDVWYDVVTEYTSDGKTEYQFEYTSDDSSYLLEHSVILNAPYAPNQTRNLVLWYRNLFKNGPKLRYKKVYKKEPSGAYQQVAEEETRYISIDKPGYPYPSGLTGLYVEHKMYCDDYADGIFDYGLSYDPGLFLIDKSFAFENYYILINTEKVATVIKKTFDANNNFIEQRTDYNYVVHDGIINLASETTASSTSAAVSKQILYPMSDLSMLTQEQQTAAGAMIASNRLTTPLVETHTVGNSQTVQINQYKDWGNNLLLPEKLYIQKGAGAQEPRIIYHNYDSYGNPVYIVKDNADKVVYLWGYNGQYPIAEIKGAAYSDVTGIIPESTLNAIAAKSELSAADSTTINSLRNSLHNALVATYTYKPLVGMTSMTDQSGIVTKYEYDSFGRLIKVTNEDKLLETYSYHYADTPPEAGMPSKIEFLDIRRLLESGTTYTTSARIHISKPCAVSFTFAYILSPSVSGSLLIGDLFSKALSGSEIGNISSLILPAGDTPIEIRLTGNLHEAATEAVGLSISGTECSDIEIGNNGLDGTYTWSVSPPLL